MNKLPAKQIYLLSIIIIGIIALSVYSTYALFTLETETSDIVSIHTPNSLTISENIYEYQQIKVEPNKVTTTDIDIYNSFEYDVCYSIWYKVVGENIDETKIQVFEKSNGTRTSNGILTPTNNMRVTIGIINDSDEEVKINIGTIGAKQENNSCSLNLDTDKNLITETYQFEKTLLEQLLETKDTIKEEENNYIIHKNITDIITYKNTDKIYISETFKYKNEIFTLEEPVEVTIDELIGDKYLGNKLEKKTIYFCKENKLSCSILYKITEIKEQNQTDEVQTEINENQEEEEIKEIYYNIEKYDKLIGYMEGTSGLRKINDKDYVFYGDNPDNYIYYNCKNKDISSCELWRIVGLYYDDTNENYNMKIVRNESIGKYQFDNTEEPTNLTWTNSTLYKYLNKEYQLENNYNNFIVERIPDKEILLSLDTEIKITKIEKEDILLSINEETEMEEENTITEENKDDEKEIELKINILSIEDYLNTSSCKKNKITQYTNECFTNNWLNNIEIDREWTLTEQEPKEIPVEEPTTENDELLENEENLDEQITTEEPTDETTNENEDNKEDETTTEEEPTEEEIIEPIKTIIINSAYGIKEDIIETNVKEFLDVRPVVYIKSRMLLISGNGTFETPYIIK